MRCARCPLFSSWNTESDRCESCAIFGDSWDSPFQYENKDLSMIVGCYIEKAYIDKVDAEMAKEHKYIPLETRCIESDGTMLIL